MNLKAPEYVPGHGLLQGQVGTGHRRSRRGSSAFAAATRAAEEGCPGDRAQRCARGPHWRRAVDKLQAGKRVLQAGVGQGRQRRGTKTEVRALVDFAEEANSAGAATS